MKLAAIMQPTYLPWCGYFDMIDRADVFVLLDTVQFSRQSWQQRNRVRLKDGREVWLTVPVRAKLGTRLDLVEVAGHEWQRKHLATMASAYKKAPHWDEVEFAIGRVYEKMRWERLLDLNETLIWVLMELLGFATPIVRASSLGSTRAGRIERLQDLLSLVEADALLEPKAGSYLQGAPFHVEWHQFEHPVYSQDGLPFASHLSVVDLLAHHGPDSLGIIRNG